MIREEKSITLGSAYDFIDLSKYTNNKKSIKVISKDTMKEFTEWTLTDYGSLRIELGVIDYKKYKNPYNIKMIVEYEPSPLPIELYEIDTLKGLEKNITDIKQLDYISNLRLVAARKFHIRLNKFIICNSMFFDEFGQTMKLNYDNINEYDYSFGTVVTITEFRNKIESFSYGSSALPSADSVCPHCKQKWTLRNIRDCIRYRDDLYHKDCNNYNLYEKTKKEFNFICSSVFTNYTLRAIKNGYGSADYMGPWFIINTDDGDIRIGWRKRVIEINWLPNYKKFKFDGYNEDTTKTFDDDRYIHAWSDEKAIEYLQNAYKTIIKD